MEHERVRDPVERPAVRWAIGCLIGAAALAGSAIVVAWLSFALLPPTWLQVVVGTLLVLGVVALVFLVVNALGRRVEAGSERPFRSAGPSGGGPGGPGGSSASPAPAGGRESAPSRPRRTP